jgi:hypothetical protein
MWVRWCLTWWGQTSPYPVHAHVTAGGPGGACTDADSYEARKGPGSAKGAPRGPSAIKTGPGVPEGVRLGVRTARSHITGPIRGLGRGARHYGARGPPVRQSRSSKPGEPVGGPGPFKWQP